ncbi:MAG: hypothetical protein JW973_05030 [Bacteroidales bacterium]|nr:hypothetical protein [Bacteroidales bacterium]
MASIRYLKKHLKSLTEDLKDECLVFLVIHPEAKTEKIAHVIQEINSIEAELLFRLNHYNYKPEELSAKQFINASIADAEKKLDKLQKELQESIK